MSEVRYDAHPSLIRTRPFATLLTLALLVLGVAAALFGKQVLPGGLPLELTRALEGTDDRMVQVGGLAIFVIACLRLLIWWVATRSDRLKVTGDELLWTHGLFSKEYTEIDLGSVRTVKVSQSLFQRVMGAGDVSVFTTGDLPELVVRGLPEPNRIRELVKVKAVGGAES
jgi:uncharacterized membrane protein YdbT with pleckstrin-like domain